LKRFGEQFINEVKDFLRTRPNSRKRANNEISPKFVSQRDLLEPIAIDESGYTEADQNEENRQSPFFRIPGIQNVTLRRNPNTKISHEEIQDDVFRNEFDLTLENALDTPIF